MELLMARKVYCCMQFFNEVELLKIKAEELQDVVDVFITSESSKTHSGLDKPLYLENGNFQSSKYQNMLMVNQVIYNTPSSYQELLDMEPSDETHKQIIEKTARGNWWDHKKESYLRDTYEKEMLVNPLLPFGCQDEDIIILGDLDEIPKASAVKKIVNNFQDGEIYNLQHDFYWYFANILKDEQWYGNIILDYKTLKENSFCELRTHKRGNFVKNAGWHMSYFGGVDRVRQKIASWGEQSLNVPQVINNVENNIKNCLINSRDLFFRPAKFSLVPLTYKTHPEYLVDNQDEFKDFIYESK